MKKILIITSSYGENSSIPCGKDMYTLVQFMSKDPKVNITVLTALCEDKDLLESCNIKINKLSTNKQWREKLTSDFYSSKSFVDKLQLRFKLRQLNHRMERDYFAGDAINYDNLYMWLCEQKNDKYDLIISVSYPFYIQKQAHIIQKKMNIKRWIMYLLDPYADNIHDYKDTRRKRIREEKKLFKSCTNIFAVEELITKRRYSPINRFVNKIDYIPTHLLANNTEYSNVRDTKKVHFVYAGTFYKDIRNPEKLLQIFTCLPDNYILSLYSAGCDDIIDKYKEVLGERLNANGFVSGDAYKRIIQNADILVDVGNTVSNQVPSKILDYCSYGKPILHFVNCAEEVVSQRFSQYPFFLNADYNGDNANICSMIIGFSEKSVGKKVDYSLLRSCFGECTVEYIGGTIEKILMNI